MKKFMNKKYSPIITKDTKHKLFNYIDSINHLNKIKHLTRILDFFSVTTSQQTQSLLDAKTKIICEIFISEEGLPEKTRKKTGNKWFETQDQIAYKDEFLEEKPFKGFKRGEKGHPVWLECPRWGERAMVNGELVIKRHRPIKQGKQSNPDKITL